MGAEPYGGISIGAGLQEFLWRRGWPLKNANPRKEFCGSLPPRGGSASFYFPFSIFDVYGGAGGPVKNANPRREVLQTSRNSLSCWLVLPFVNSWWLVFLNIWALMFPSCSLLFTRPVAFTQRGGPSPLEVLRTRLNTPTPSSILKTSTSPPRSSRNVSRLRGFKKAGGGSRSRQLTRKTSWCQ